MTQALPKASRPRPLSPHLSVYRPQISSVLSFFHRATGAANAIGSVLLALWIWSAAFAPELFEMIQAVFSHWLGQLVLIGWTFSIFYHLSNGVRHLFWDVGLGYSIPVMTRSGLLVLAIACGMTALVWLPFWMEV